jgi:lipopolysaccharide assembly outer membrane protein LptD (OstA)
VVAEGNAQIKDPKGTVTRADRFEMLDDMRDAFLRSLSTYPEIDALFAKQAQELDRKSQ